VDLVLGCTAGRVGFLHIHPVQVYDCGIIPQP
jgi:hypothetical protein